MQPVLAVRNLSLSFDSVQVLSDVTFDLKPTEVLGIVGHNGSGKSTIVKVLSGYYAPHLTSEVAVFGQALTLPLDPEAQFDLGFAIIHQDLALVGDATVWENIGFGRYKTHRAFSIDSRRERHAARQYLEVVGWKGSVDVLIRELPLPDQARVALARGLRRLTESKRPGCLILDEAMNFFERREVDQFMDAIREQARAMGFGVIMIGHQLDEILKHCDRVVVLRDGHVVEDRASGECNEQDLVSLMVGEGREQPIVQSSD